ncbi:hypothetical protein [Flavobacterium hungaricum]|uniref:Alpha-L-rhamnosidase six-hairpin glycosidase domain-containing protein n=1 Tax=Flavobacterium hungaricum TaxID=2082725 RepID=A0ABR9TM07_9FLAO|nr:hypothetical protein [Flavobacterium hungaricum]MBE8726408.1 hypothetical protein [Flavobacterium hungaricum]
MNTISPWAATVQADLESSVVIWEKEWHKYNFQAYNAGDSLWIAVTWPDRGKMAFRAAFGMNSCFTITNMFDDGQTLVLNLETRLGRYEVIIAFPDENTAILHYTTTFKANQPLLIPFWPRDIIPLTQKGSVENTNGKIHMHQMGSRSGILFASMTKPKTGSFFYFQDLGSLSAYCEATQTTVDDTVCGSWPEIGFKLPSADDKPLPSDKPYIISDAYVLFSEDIIEDDIAVTHQFLNNLAAVYRLLPHPEIIYHNWPEITQNCLNDIYSNKGCWTQTNGSPYLNAYLCDYDTPAEVMVQLAVLMPLNELKHWYGETHSVYNDLLNGIDAFYDQKVKSINRWLPALNNQLDNSEIQKKEMVMDSWYLYHPLMNLTRLALKGEKKAEELVLKSIQYAIKVAHHFDYQWPVFFKMDTLEIIRKETEPGKGGEKDVPGSYAHLMLLEYRLTDDKRYLNEAERSVKKLAGCGFHIFYQANNTAFSAGALLELFKITGKKEYLDLSYACMACLFKNMQLWDCQYGFGKNYTNYFSVFPLNNAPYTAAYEEMEVYAALSEYLIQAAAIDLLPSLKILIAEFIKYAVCRLPFYYPVNLPLEMISEEVKTGEIQKELWIPLEDLYNGWEKSGQVGQEVYGAGVGFGAMIRQYHKVKNEDFLLFLDYPLINYRKSKQSVLFTVLGSAEFECNFKIVLPENRNIKFQVFAQKQIIEPAAKSNLLLEYTVAGGSAVKVSWK